MQLPIDVTAFIKEMADVKDERDEPIAVSVYIDETAPNDLAAHVRNAFASSSGHVRMTVSYVGKTLVANPTDDMAVLVAGETGLAGKQAEEIRAVGVPVMVATLTPERIGRVSQNADHPVPDGDIVSPWDDGETSGKEEGVLTEVGAAALDERMGRWIVAVCRSKKLSFAVAFPFMRRPLAKDSIQVTALENAGIGIVPFIPGADLPLITLNQVKMALQIAAAYGLEIDKTRLKEVGAVIVGAYLSRSLARKLVAAVPVVGFVFKGGVAYTTSIAMGYALLNYFEGGEDATGVANVLERATETSAKAVSFVRDKAEAIAPLLANAKAQM